MKKRIPLTAIIAFILGVIAVPVLAQTGAGIGIDSTPYAVDKEIYYDANGDGVNQPEELLGKYDAYNPQDLFNFHWGSMSDAEFYRVSLIQYLPPGKGPGGPSQEIKISHHSAGDPNGPRFSMSPYGSQLCLGCVTVIKVVPETLSLSQNSQGATTRQYTALSGVLVSEPFVFELPPQPERSSKRSGPSCTECGDGICSPGEEIVTGVCACYRDCDIE